MVININLMRKELQLMSNTTLSTHPHEDCDKYVIKKETE